MSVQDQLQVMLRNHNADGKNQALGRVQLTLSTYEASTMFTGFVCSQTSVHSTQGSFSYICIVVLQAWVGSRCDCTMLSMSELRTDRINIIA